MTPRTLTGNFEISGLGWIPPSPNDRFAVTIHYRHDDHIEVAITSHQRPSVDIPVLHVITLSAGCASVLDLKSQGSSRTFSGENQVVQTVYIARLLVVGKHVDASLGTTFSITTFTHVDQWIRRYDTDLSRLPDIPLSSVPSLEQLALTASIVRSEGVGSQTTTVRWAVRRELPSAEGMASLIQFGVDLRELFALCIGSPVYVEDIALSNSESVAIFYSTYSKVPQGQLYPFAVPVPFAQFEPIAHTVVPAWRVAKSELRDPINLLATVLYQPALLIDVQFLLLVMAMESYHRKVYGGEYMSQEDYLKTTQAWRNSIPSGLSVDHRNSLSTRLKYGNEFSLRKRLRELVRSIPEPAQERILGSMDPADFIDDVVNRRNTMVHNGAPAGTLGDVVRSTGLLRQFMAYLLLKRVGIELDPSRIQHLL